MRGRPWTPEDKALFDSLWGTGPPDTLAKRLKRTRAAVEARAYKLGWLGPGSKVVPPEPPKTAQTRPQKKKEQKKKEGGPAPLAEPAPAPVQREEPAPALRLADLELRYIALVETLSQQTQRVARLEVQIREWEDVARYLQRLQDGLEPSGHPTEGHAGG